MKSFNGGKPDGMLNNYFALQLILLSPGFYFFAYGND
jgi:hypothetical protein